MKKLAVVLACALFLAFAHLSLAQAGPPLTSPWTDPNLRVRVEPALLKKLLVAAPGERIPMIVMMREQAAPALGRSALAPTLQATAARTQAAVRAFLAGEETAGRAESIRPFWIFNGLALAATQETAQALAQRSDVALIRLDRFEQRLAPGEHLANAGAGLAWGVQRVRANLVWSALNDTGAGVVVANMDTGVDFLHPALNPGYRGNVGKGLYQHEGNWFDATDAGAVYPVDPNGHGTHTMGTMAGQEGIGVAPGARWIAVRILNTQGMGYESWIHAGFQWLLAPGGDPKNAPQVVNNSWGNSLDTSTEFANDVARLQQQGIFVVFSAGNAGPIPQSLGSPASLPGVLAVGATDSDDEVAIFSSRGPSPWHEIKPQLAAPGVGVPSSLPGAAYGLNSGTSMAAPHVSGIAALILAIHPGLSIAATQYALTSTAVSHNPIIPNNDTGWGRVDAYAAVQAAAGAGILEGTAIDAGSRLPLPNTQVTFTRQDVIPVLTLDTDATGAYRAGVVAGVYTVSGTRFGYRSDSASNVHVITATTTAQDLVLSPLPTGVLEGNLTDAAVSRPATATVTVLNTPVSQTGVGRYHLDLPIGTYTIQARGLGYHTAMATVTVQANQVTQHNFGLTETPRILLVNSGAWYYDEYPQYYRDALDGLGLAYDEKRIKHIPEDVPAAADLRDYNLVIWSAPQDSPGLIGASQAITPYLESGGRLILTGQDVAFWDGGGPGLAPIPYLRDYLKTTFVNDDAGSRMVTGIPGDIMAGLSMSIAGGAGANNQDWPDEIGVADSDFAATVLGYAGDGNAANRVGLCLPYRALVLGFGAEAISTTATRQQFLTRAIDYLFGPPLADGFSLERTNAGVQVGPPGSVVTFTLRARNIGESGGPVTYQAGVQPGAWSSMVTPSQFTLAPCKATVLTVTTSIPQGTAIDVRDILTLNLAPVGRPAASKALTLTAKAPAPLLLVDHHRWYDVRSAYVESLQAAGIRYDLWTLPPDGAADAKNGPPAGQLSWYPLVLWFTGYDWYLPVAPYDETQLSSYLDHGGRLMMTSAFYLDQRGASAFARQRLGVLNYTTGMTATQTYGSPGHPLGAGIGPIELFDPFPRAGFYTLDATIAPSTAAATAWRGDHNRALAIARDTPGNRLVFWAIPFEALATPGRTAVLQRTLGWLGSLGRSTVQINPPLIAAGQPATVTTVIRDDLAAARASLALTLPPGTRPNGSPLPPGVTYTGQDNTLHFAGSVEVGRPLTFTFGLATAGIAPGRASGRAVFRDERLGISYDQPLALAVAAPDLATSALEVQPARANQPGTVTLWLRNTGPASALAASATCVIPLGSRLVTDTLVLTGPGVVQVGESGVTWRGALTGGQSASVTFKLRPPSFRHLTTLPVELLAWDGLGGAWERRAWLAVQPSVIHMAIVADSP